VKTKKNILKFIAGLILTALVVLFLHSETKLFDHHTELCKSVDLCLILDKASCSNHSNIGNFIKILYVPCLVFIQQINYVDYILESIRFIKPEYLLHLSQQLTVETQILKI
jgi:hypothetical protein